MNERRSDLLTGDWTTFSTRRQDRTFLPSPEDCPLCPTRDPSHPTEIPFDDFQIAVFDNRFPSLMDPPPPPSTVDQPAAPVARSTGAAEVIVYGPDHERGLASMPSARIARVVDVWADRYDELGKRDGVRYVLIFENRGIEVGVTLQHPHGQIYAFPDLPPRPRQQLAHASRYMDRTGRCVSCDTVAIERADGVRIVTQNDSFVAFVPFAARFPYQVDIVARRHVTSLLDLTLPERERLADAIRRVLGALDAVFSSPMPYVMSIQQLPPKDVELLEVSHLRVEYDAFRRAPGTLKYLAGSEIGGGAFMNDVAPEEAASRLREAIRAA